MATIKSPTRKTSSLKLNLGSGSDYKEGWVNVDNSPLVRADVVHDLYNPLPFPDGSAEEVLAQDILEHFTQQDGEKLIAEIARVLRKDGTLLVRVPNVDDIFQRFSDDQDTRNIFLYGDTTKTGVFGSHKVGYSKELLVATMRKLGLSLQEIKEVDTNFEASFVKKGDTLHIKKVAFINQTLDVGGAETFNCDLLQEFVRSGVQIDASVTHPPFARMLEEKGIFVTSLPVVMDIIGDWKGLVKALFLFPRGMIQYFLCVNRAKKASADLILLSGFTEKILVTPLAKMYGIPVVWIEFGPISPLFKKFLGLPKILYRLVKDIPFAVIVPSNYTKSDVISAGRISLAKLWLIPCGRAITKKDLKPYLSVSVQKHQIICVSRLEEGKGQDLLIRALPKIVKKYPDTKLILTGKAGTLLVLQKLVETLHLQKHVDFVGWVPDVLQKMAESQVCVFPSVWPLEGFGLVTVEAMALGKPVVAFRTGPAPEIISHEKNGLLAKPGDVKDLETQILRFFDTPKFAQTLGENASQDFYEKYQIEAVVQKYANVLRDVLAHELAQKDL